ncbi:MAG: hypothetical protein ACRCYB_06620 [Aeromonas veronii]
MIDLDKLTEVMDEIIDSGGKESHLYVDEVLELITRLRQAEKDAARYRWIKENSQLGVGKFGFDWELHFGGAAPDNHSLIESHIDEAMNASNN